MTSGTICEAIDQIAELSFQNGATFQDLEGLETYYSYSDLRSEIYGAAAYLSACGLNKGNVVIFCVTLPEEFIVTFLACLKMGIVATPVAPSKYSKIKSEKNRLKAVIELTKAKTIVCSDDNLADIKAFCELTNTRLAKVKSNERLDEVPDFPVIKPDDIAYFQLTSGTTSLPKAVVNTHANLIANIRGITGEKGLQTNSSTDKCVSWLPLYHDMGIIGFVLCPLYRRISTVYIPMHRFLRNPKVWLEAIARHRGTVTYAANFAYLLINRLVKDSDLQQWDLSCIKVMGCGAEPIKPDVICEATERLHRFSGMPVKAIKPSYGLAEISLCATITPKDEAMHLLKIDEQTYRETKKITPPREGKRVIEHVSCGACLENIEIHIVDEQGNLLPEGICGEIVVNGPVLAQGYYDNPKDTAANFKHNGFHTGDIGYLYNNNLYISGRKKDLIIHNGRNISAHEIEWCVESLEGTRKGSVITFSVLDENTEKVYLLVGLKAEANSELLTKINSILFSNFSFSVEKVFFVSPNEIPKTSSGKLQRGLAKKRFMMGDYEEKMKQ